MGLARFVAKDTYTPGLTENESNMFPLTSTPFGGKRGIDALHDPHINKSTAFSEAEREALGLTGFLFGRP